MLDRLNQQQQRNEEQINAIKQTRFQPNRQSNFQPNRTTNYQPFNSNNTCSKCGKLGHKAAFCRTFQLGQPRLKKVCEYHGSNAGHTSAECIVLQRVHQRQEREARGYRQDQNVRFSDTNVIIPSNVATNNNDLSKYNRVIRYTPSETENQTSHQPETDSLLRNQQKDIIKDSDCSIFKEGKVLSEPSTELNIDDASKDKKPITKRTKNIKTNSSSPYLEAILEDYYQRPIGRGKRMIQTKAQRIKQGPAKWRKVPNSINSILDIEILKVKGRLNDIINEQILVDTGARSNVISREMVQKLNLLHQIVPTDIRLSTANNSSLQVLGKIILSMKWQEDEDSAIEEANFNYVAYQDQVDSINACAHFDSDSTSQPDQNYHKDKQHVDYQPNQFLIEFIVVEELSVPIILGTKGIKRMNMLIDFKEERIIVNGEYYPFINAQRSDALRTIKKATIPPSCIHTIGVEGELIRGIYSIEEFCQDFPIQVIDGGYTADEGRNTFKIRIKNLSNQKWTIPAKSKIAVAMNPTCVSTGPESKSCHPYSFKDNIQIQIQGDERSISAISQSWQLTPILIRDYEERINMIQEKRMLKEEMIMGKKITNKERDALFEVIKKEEATFKEKLSEEIRSDILPKYSMKLKEDATPHIAAMGRLSPDKEDMLEKEMADLLKRGLIEYSDGTWRARVVLVKKKDGKWRRCIDYRVLNEMTIADSYPMVRIDETLDQLGKAKYFSKLDMVEGYYQIPLHEDSKVYTGFATRSGFYQWKYLPMGFKNAGAAFQRQMDTVLGNMRFKFCIPYIDDIIIYSQTFEEHINHLKQVFEQFRKFGLFVKMSKCEFCMDRMDFLGHEVSAEGLRPNANKVKAINAMPAPTDPKQLVRFMAMAGFYRRYIKDFAKRTHTLRALCKQDAKWEWSSIHQSEVDDIKDALTSQPVMAYPDWDKKFILTTDASLKGLGAILSQEYENGERVIAYASRALAEGERKWGITELEALAVIWGTEQFKVYLEDRPFDLITDHKALLAFKKITNTNPRLERWSIKLSRFTYNILYRKGEENVNADCLSRDPIESINVIEQELIEKQNEDIFIKQIRKAIEEKGEIEFVRNGEEMEMISTFKICENQWFIERKNKIYNRIYNATKKVFIDRIVIPQSLKKLVLKECHETGHFDYTRTYEKMRERFYWNGMSKDTKDYVSSCEECQRRNHTKPFKRGPMFSFKVDRKFQLLGVDLYSGIPKGSVTNYDTILVMTDYLTKWVVAVPIEDASTTTVAEAIYNNWIIHYGVPEEIISDEGGEFNAKSIYQNLYDIFKIKKLTTTSYHQQTNGQCERFNRTMSGMLAKYTKDDQTKWDIYLPTCVLEYNNSIHSVTKESPHFMVFGQESRIPIDLVIKKDEIDALNPSIKERTAMAVKRIRENQHYNKVKYDKRRTNETFKRGDFVLWRQEPRTNMALDEHAKLISPWYGPVTIFKDIGQNKYIVIDDDANPKTINAENLKKYQKRPDWMKDDVPEEMEVDDEKVVSPAMKPSTKENEDDIPKIDPISNPVIIPNNIQAEIESMDVEVPTNVRRSTREKKYKPAKGDEIDMRFVDKKTGKKEWYCGTVTKIDEEDKDMIYCKFLDQCNEDWYDSREEELEIRRCIPNQTHKRSPKGQINLIRKIPEVLSIQTDNQQPKESGEIRNKAKQKRLQKRELEGGRTRAKRKK
ncbi:MAG TPA: reverse transcriptase domain-containing protein [Candidatus Limnocylindrales bacterium]|nr:reverse transcriptase domain-containing protein [Candidatus Limnocylindrales bacterium]